MDTYQVKVNVYSFNILMCGDLSLEDDQEETQFLYQDLEKLGYSGTTMVGTTLSSLSVLANLSETLDSKDLTTVEVIVDETAERRDGIFFEYVMPIGAKGLLIVDTIELDSLPTDRGEVNIPIPWSGLSTLQLLAPDGFNWHPEEGYLVNSLRVIVSPELPQQ